MRTYKLLLLLSLSGAYSIIQMDLYLQVNIILVIYKSRNYSIDYCVVKIILNILDSTINFVEQIGWSLLSSFWSIFFSSESLCFIYFFLPSSMISPLVRTNWVVMMPSTLIAALLCSSRGYWYVAVIQKFYISPILG